MRWGRPGSGTSKPAYCLPMRRTFYLLLRHRRIRSRSSLLRSIPMYQPQLKRTARESLAPAAGVYCGAPPPRPPRPPPPAGAPPWPCCPRPCACAPAAWPPWPPSLRLRGHHSQRAERENDHDRDTYPDGFAFEGHNEILRSTRQDCCRLKSTTTCPSGNFTFLRNPDGAPVIAGRKCTVT